MFLRSLFFGFTASLMTSTALAQTPAVATDILPVHSLTARVMQGVGAPTLLLPPGANPHAHAMRPSEVRGLQEADLVIWMGEALTPWMEDTIHRVAPDTKTITLLEVDNTTVFDTRDNALFADADDHAGHKDDDHHDDHDDDHKDGHHDEHDDDHKDDHHDEHDDDHKDDRHDDHDDDEHGHHHDGVDPHAWLSPENAVQWLGVIAENLAQADPENAQTYRDNAKVASIEITAFTGMAQAQLTTVQDATILVYHDAYQYFERSFGLPITGSIAQSDATKPGAARLAELREAVSGADTTCVVAEPQHNSRLIDTIASHGTKVIELDPVGSLIPQGPDHYLTLLQQMTTGFLTCGE